MIAVDRSSIPPPEILTKEGAAGPLETTRAILFFKSVKPRRGKKEKKKKQKKNKKGAARKKKKSDAPQYKVYKDDSVKDALDLLFKHKCAYCESRYPAVHPMDVEHWRPKAAVENLAGEKFEPGYYWLAANWDNLLPSCIHCNRRSYHAGPAESDESVKMGKQSLFPVADEARRLRRHDQPDEEAPLLLNPCLDQPEEHLVFPGDEERGGIVQPCEVLAGQPSRKAQVSIDVYGLNRVELVRERKAKFLLICEQIERVDLLIQDLDEATTERSRQKISVRLKKELEILKRFTQPDEPYAQMSRQVINPFLKSKTASRIG